MAKEGTLFGIGFWTDLKMALKKCFTGPIIKLDASMVGATTKKDVEEMGWEFTSSFATLLENWNWPEKTLKKVSSGSDY